MRYLSVCFLVLSLALVGCGKDDAPGAGGGAGAGAGAGAGSDPGTKGTETDSGDTENGTGY